MDTNAFDYANRVIAGSETETYKAVNPCRVSDEDLGPAALTSIQRLGYLMGALAIGCGSVGMIFVILMDMAAKR